MPNIASTRDYDNKVSSPSTVKSFDSGGILSQNGYGKFVDKLGNVFLGLSYAFRNIGENNIMFGSDSGKNITSGNENILIGKKAGSNLVSSNRNIIIGHNSYSNTTNTTNEIVIGSNTTGNGSNTITLPDETKLFVNSIKVDTSNSDDPFVISTGSSNFYIHNDGAVTVNTSTAYPNAFLTVNGNIKCNNIVSDGAVESSNAQLISITKGAITSDQLTSLNSYFNQFQTQSSKTIYMNHHYPNIDYEINNPFSGGVYTPTQNRIYFVPACDASNSNKLWHYIDCNTGEFNSYGLNVTISGNSTTLSYVGGCYSPLENKIYLAPFGASNNETWHRICCDGRPDIVEGYTPSFESLGTNLYKGCVYAPISNTSPPSGNKIYFIPNRLNGISQLHYINCSDGSVNLMSISTGYASNITQTGYNGGCYSPRQHRIYLAPDGQYAKSQWHYIDCATNTLVAYTHGVTPTGPFGGAVYDPTQNRIYLLTNSGNADTLWYYIDCSNGTVNSFSVSIPTTFYSFTGGCYSIPHNRIYLSQNLTNTQQKSFFYIDCSNGSVGRYTPSTPAYEYDEFNTITDYSDCVYSPTENKIYFIHGESTGDVKERWLILNEGEGFPISKMLLGHSMFN